ncbi:YceI family protein [Oceanospirillum sediminis]|uniref:YceI family protein n=1 Tax=Oceanospirillum sediminis TaxID=2760088 RepID=A0A839IJJ1_9GAMM|nr:YceI family protein [Oceanospirillum sediminis]MBB1485345.1 YceI family protein [Oceanospirillum sediminis]
MIKALFTPALLSAALISGSALAADYDIDPAHTTVLFKINHLGFSETVGRFNTFNGSYSYDEAKPSASAIEVTIDAESLDTNHDARDKHIKSPDFLDTKQYPEITFKSKGYKGSATQGTLTGELTLHGVTKDVNLAITKVGEGKDPWGNYRSGFNGSVTIKREEFGVDQMLGGIGNDVTIELFVEGIRK